MRIAGYLHEIDDWCPADVYPVHIVRLDAIGAEDLLRGGFCCTRAFEARAVALGLRPSDVANPRPLAEGDELVLLKSWPTNKPTDRYWWLVTRAVKLP